MDQPASPPTPVERAQLIHRRLPSTGLFAGQEWRVAPEPFSLGPEITGELQTLGRMLLQFYRALNMLYRASVDGRQPPWVAAWLELGKPANLIEVQRSASLKNHLPRVIRPDLLPTDHGLKITELDSVPGGIGLTAWLNRAYSEFGFNVIGGAEGMLHGFASIFGDSRAVHVVVSEESATYRPEMMWLTQQLNNLGLHFHLRDASPFQPADGDAVYRFFELFDLQNVPAAPELFNAATQKRIFLTPPPKSFFEEKLSFALLWNRRLRSFWRQELGASFLDRLQSLIPMTWVLDPAPLPPHAGIPELNLAGWDELTTLSHRERALVVKVSGFSPKAWGARGVTLGIDVPAPEWTRAVHEALALFPSSPHILQRYEKPRRVPLRWVDLEKLESCEAEGRARLCPYYFVSGEGDGLRSTLGGVLATICPADKKILHGMRDAVMAPCIP